MPMTAYDLRLLLKQETPLVIGKLGSWTKRFKLVVSSESKVVLSESKIRHKYGKSE